MSTAKLFLGILAGVAAGLLLGASFAPRTTAATQKLPKK
jgi:gas vesicle protein